MCTPVTTSAPQARKNSPSRGPKKRKKTSDPVEEYLIAELSKTSERDEATSFGDHVAARLRSFSAEQRARACLEIDKVLYDVQFPSQLPQPPYPYPPYNSHNTYDN